MTKTHGTVLLALLHRRWLGVVGLLVAALLVAGWSVEPTLVSPAHSAPAGKVTLPPDLDLVPHDSPAFVSIQVAELLKSDFGQKLLPKLRKDAPEFLSNIEKELGVPLDTVERVTLLPAPTLVIVRTTKAYHRTKLLETLAPKAKEIEHKNRKIYQEQHRGRGVCFVDDRVFVRGRISDLKHLFDWPAAKEDKAVLGEALVQATQNHVVAGLNPAGILLMFFAAEAPRAEPGGGFEEIKPGKEPPSIKDKEKCGDDKPKEPTLEEMLRELPHELLPYKPLLQAQSATLTLNFGDESKLAMRIVCADEEVAKDAEIATQTALYVLRESLLQWARDMGLDDKGKPLDMLKQLQAALKAASVQRKGTEVQAIARLKTDAAAVAGIVTAVESQAMRVRSINNLKQIGIAMHNYQTNLGFMPPPAIYGNNGQPLLSWRVALLPWIEDDDTGKLAAQFRMDEPWDSDHNKKLLAKMPKVYAPVTGQAKDGHATYYQVFTGQDTPFFGNRKANIVNIFQDGTSNTFMVVEAGEAVPWTKPDDIPYDAKKPVPKLGGLFGDGFHACMGDGSVHFVKKTIDEKTLRALITPAGGEAVDWYKFVVEGRGRRIYHQNRHELPPPPPTFEKLPIKGKDLPKEPIKD